MFNQYSTGDIGDALLLLWLMSASVARKAVDSRDTVHSLRQKQAGTRDWDGIVKGVFELSVGTVSWWTSLA